VNAGTYTVTLNASNAYGFNVFIMTDAVSVLPAPIANFTYAPGEGNAPLTVLFNDTSAGNVTVWNWDFGDGNTSSEQNPSHTYMTAGTYTVSLNASNAYGSNVSTVTDAVRVLLAPAAGFTFAPDEGNAPMTVTFTATSSGNVTAWSWDFGDGNVSSLQNPVYTYADAGIYTVTLNASNAYGFNVSTMTDAISVLPAPVANFTGTPNEGNAPLTVTFTDASTGNVTAWNWDFGDGNTSAEQSPVHTYVNAGCYTVSLNASNAYGFDVSVIADGVHVLSAPVANFTYTPGEGNAPLAVQFTDASIGDVTAWLWDFGDGNISAEQSPLHIYAIAGTYAVSLNTSNAYGFNVSTLAYAVQVLESPNTGFTCAPDEGNVPLTVTFTDVSTGNITAWLWDFGDGNTSTDRNTTHTYASAGTYTVSLNASNAYGFNVSTVADAVSVLAAPVANFTCMPGEGNAPLAVQFNDASAGNVTAWSWDFGDGNTSAEASPSHTYANAGTYTISLNASNAYGFNVSTVSDAVLVLSPPSANFTYTPGEGNAPLTVQFNDTSSGNVTAWTWDFGDGQTSAEQNPIHTYANAGIYTISLNASNAYGFSIATMTDAVSVLPAPAANFTYAPGEGNAPLVVQFNDASIGNVTVWAWDFGDGAISSERNPAHTYASAGVYTVSLNASNAYWFDVFTVTDAVSVLPAPVANFTYTPEEGNAPLTVAFTDASVGNVTAWIWDFGDGNVSFEQSPVHVYAIAGTYTVTLNASNAYGFNISAVTDAVRVLPAPSAGFT
jgi:PKD repeat protein